MERRRKRKLRATIWALAVVLLFLSNSATARAGDTFDYGTYAAVLDVYVDEHGMVAYKSLKENREKLDAFATDLATLSPQTYSQWTDKEKVAFWINAYNALTLLAIINHYPIEPSFVGSFLYPKNSIRQISGVWDKLQFAVMGSKMTLDEIEHETLRKNFDEPRIHMALVCAAKGCPPLRSEPYTGEKLDAQLDDQTIRFLKDPGKLRIDPVEGKVYTSSIFKWFGKDFVKKYGTQEKFADKSETERAPLAFISEYVDQSIANYLATGDYALEYLDYDWSLNEQGDT
ncbi:MAG: DUF547 domain-containing protein [Candidatus Abyssobacteria bacterium SURF_17]|uniref:DUF547 domain-containing protein n=1 Tax=Candidatus Abyssobacteria bacterium SURF_17 TaxID=2093361 RepID=A0A419F8W1_9BACT|nr:MAG: DUF547 domain-containing protein [Candidatus Abyssubacteria bacterium SURF_17]